MWSIEPYKSYRNYFNVYRVDIVSGESGIGCDPDLSAGRKNTPLSMAFWGGCNPSSVQRLITMSNSAANTYANLVTGTRNGTLSVRSGVTCLNDARINGGVTVSAGASLVVTGGTISGAVTATGAAEVHLLKARVNGAVSISGTTGRLVIAGAELRGAATLNGNTTTDPLVMAGSSVHGALACAGNTPAPSNAGVANQITGSGQCAGLVDPRPNPRGKTYEAVVSSTIPERGMYEHNHN